VINFHLDYFICCSLVSSGVLQIAATSSRTYLFCFFSRPMINVSFAVGFIITGLLIFFTTANRNINDFKGGLDGNEQAFLFYVALSVSFFVTSLVTSATNRKKHLRDHNCAADSFICLKHDTYVNLIKLRWKYFFKKSRS